MAETMKTKPGQEEADPRAAGMTDADILEAMKSVSGYLDITPADFKELYRIAYRHAAERFARSVTARDIMTRDVVSVKPEDTLENVVGAMSAKRISGVPVLDPAGKVLGIISEKDIVSRLLGDDSGNLMSLVSACIRAEGCLCRTLRSLTAKEIMTSPVVTVLETASLAEIAELLAGRKVNRLPVTDQEGRLLGFLTRNDIVNATLKGGTCS
jgi:CBS domain-containing membrane protein